MKHPNDACRPARDPISAAMHDAKRGLVAVCPAKFQRLMTNRQLNQASIIRKADVSPNWLRKLMKGESVLRSKLDELCEHLEIAVQTILPDTDTEKPTPKQGFSLTPPSGWEIAEYLGPFRQAANKLSYRTTRLQHQFVPEKKARGKFYDLLHLSVQKRNELTEHLTRHSRTCEIIGKHPNITENIDVRPLDDNTGWWVIDPWVDGHTLEDEFSETNREPPSPDFIKHVGAEILKGLSALHHAKIVFRELSPDKVWISTGNDRVFLTDFELAKLQDGAPSVSGLWEPGFFRAPEVSEYCAYPASDLYTWGRLMIWLLAGGRVRKPQLDTNAPLPLEVKAIISRCLQPQHSKRPQSADEILKIWSNWK